MNTNYPLYFGAFARIQAVYYGGNKMQCSFLLRDVDGDEFLVKNLTGQSNEKKEVFYLENPITVKLPISYFDEDFDGNNKIIIWGEMYDGGSKRE